ncbi:hypothetical protein OROGR_013606 [Orobanche gracilis]
MFRLLGRSNDTPYLFIAWLNWHVVVCHIPKEKNDASDFLPRNFFRLGQTRHWEDENDFLLKLCKLTVKLLKGGEPDLMTAAKVVLHDLQRGKVPYFVPPPRQEDLYEEPNVNGIDFDDGVDSNQASPAIKAITNVFSSQQQRSDLFKKIYLLRSWRRKLMILLLISRITQMKMFWSLIATHWSRIQPLRFHLSNLVMIKWTKNRVISFGGNISV